VHHAKEAHDNERALHFYNEALKLNETHVASRLAIARINLLNNDVEACQHQCVTLLRQDPDDGEASMLLADGTECNAA
jgi:tetratricopeptide repeat protein 21B